MEDFKKYTDPNISEQELDALTGKLLRAKLARDKKQRWATILENEHDFKRGSGKLQASTKPRVLYLRWLSLAASLLILVALALFLWKPDSPSSLALADTYLAEEKIMGPQTRKGDIEVELLSQKAFEAYNTGKYQEAIVFWKQIEAQNAMKVEDFFFSALSYIQLNELDQAIANFHLVQKLAASTPKYQKESNWLLALALLKNGQTAAAKVELQKVINDGWRQDKAKKLLEATLKEEEAR